MNKKNLYLAIIIIGIFGILLAGTLTVAKYSNTVAVLCGDNLSNSCNVVQNSPYSYLIDQKISDNSELKIPLTLAGMIFYGLVTLIAFSLYRFETKKKELSLKCQKRQRMLLFIFGILGVIFSTWFTYIQANILKAFCKYCLVSAFDTVVLLALISIVTFAKNEKAEEKNKVISKSKKKTSKK